MFTTVKVPVPLIDWLIGSLKIIDLIQYVNQCLNRVATVSEKSGKNIFFSRSGKSQGILCWVREFWKLVQSQGILYHFGYSETSFSFIYLFFLPVSVAHESFFPFMTEELHSVLYQLWKDLSRRYVLDEATTFAKIAKVDVCNEKNIVPAKVQEGKPIASVWIQTWMSGAATETVQRAFRALAIPVFSSLKSQLPWSKTYCQQSRISSFKVFKSQEINVNR